MIEPFDHHAALERLKLVLEAAGFRVRKKSRKETTLRVYLQGQPYPLLNPRFLPAVGQPLTARPVDLVISVWSQGGTDGASIDQHLEAIVPIPDCSFMYEPAEYRGYHDHGSFELPLRFDAAGAIDFTVLQQPLRTVRLSLEGAER